MLTAQQLLDLARVPLNDEDRERYPDPVGLQHLNQAMMMLRRKRPDLFLGQMRAHVANYALASEVPVHPMYAQCLIDYVSARWQTVDDDGSVEPRIAAFMQLCEGAL
jgi:hypothetical protein